MPEEPRQIIKPPYGPPPRRTPHVPPIQGQPMQGQPIQGQPMQGQPIQGQPMQGKPIPGAPVPPGMMPPPPKPRGWRQRFMQNYGLGMHAMLQRGELTVPNWLVGKPIVFFLISLFASLYAFGYFPQFNLLLVTVISVILFFYGCSSMSKAWEHYSEKRFLRYVFWAGFVIRMVWVIYVFFFFSPEYYDNTYGSVGDVDWYVPFGKNLSEWWSGDSRLTLSQIIDLNGSAVDDTGYPMWLGFLYFITGNLSDSFIPFVVKSILSAYCAIFIYNIAKRHFDMGTARLAALFVSLNFIMIYWCGTMLKETEMVFLCCLSVDSFDRTLSSNNKLTFKSLLPGALAGIALFFFRSALALVIFIAVFAHIIFVSRRVMSFGKKIMAGVLVAAVLFFSMGDRLMTQSHDLVEDVQSDTQKGNMEWRSEREGGNAFAKYAGAAVFAPLIFTIPFPTFNQANEEQILQIQSAGGYFIKNILSFFIILVMILLLASGEWRKHVFILAYTLGYLMVLVLSSFAQSGRFHMPVWPMLMLFAAYGVQIAKGNKRLQTGFNIVLILEVVICLFWNWFKLAGRDMI